MAGKVFFSVSMSLDGFIAPESLEELMGQQWMELQQWIFPQRFFRENLKLGEGGEEGRDNDIARETFERTGASVMGKRMFDLGEQAWPEEAPFRTPVLVVTHEKRDPGKRPGGTSERRPDRRVHDRALTRAVRLRNPPVRGRGRGPRVTSQLEWRHAAERPNTNRRYCPFLGVQSLELALWPESHA